MSSFECYSYEAMGEWPGEKRDKFLLHKQDRESGLVTVMDRNVFAAETRARVVGDTNSSRQNLCCQKVGPNPQKWLGGGGRIPMLASFGLIAQNVGGSTLASWAGLGLDDTQNVDELDDRSSNNPQSSLR